MNEDTQDNVRMSFDIPRDLHERFRSTIPWGVRAGLMRRILEITMDRIADGGSEVIGAILVGDFDPLQKKGG